MGSGQRTWNRHFTNASSHRRELLNMDNKDGTLNRNQSIFQHRRLQEFVRHIFVAHGLPEEDAETSACALVKANLRGVGSHGIARVPMYCNRLRRGVAKARPDIRVERVAPAAALACPP
jgi:hypothetical protein